MKRLLIFLIFFTLSLSLFGIFELKLGGSVGGVHNIDGQGLGGFPITLDSINTEPTTSFSFTYLTPLSSFVEGGFGFGFDALGAPNKANFSDGTSLDITNTQAYFNSVPIFASVKLTLGQEVALYLKANAGYALNIKGEELPGDLESGAYMSIGGGLQVYLLLLELAYEETKANYTTGSTTLPLDYQRITFYIGVRF